MPLADGDRRAAPGVAMALAFRREAPMLALCGLYVTAVSGLAAMIPFRMPPLAGYLSSAACFGAAALLLVCCPFLVRLAMDRPQHPLSYGRDLMRAWRMPERLRWAVPAVATLSVVSVLFTSLKSALGQIEPFYLDPALAQADVLLLGQDAWRLIQPLVGYPIVTFGLTAAYHLWIGLLFGVTVFVAGWVEQPRLRLQYLLTYLLCWIVLGSILAIALSSVGPSFYGLFYGDDRFLALSDYLARADEVLPVAALDVQERLVAMQFSGQQFYGSGISAMPSLHVAIATVFALLGWRVSRRWGLVASAYLAVIFVGSIHLGYHYAVDGLASVAVTPVLWWVAGRVAERLIGTQATLAQPRGMPREFRGRALSLIRSRRTIFPCSHENVV